MFTGSALQAVARKIAAMIPLLADMKEAGGDEDSHDNNSTILTAISNGYMRISKKRELHNGPQRL